MTDRDLWRVQIVDGRYVTVEQTWTDVLARLDDRTLRRAAAAFAAVIDAEVAQRSRERDPYPVGASGQPGHGRR